MRFKLFLISLLVVIAANAQRENLFSIDAQVRPRIEYDNGAVTPRNTGDQPAVFVGNRTRVALGYQRKNLEFKASVQHTGVWGQDNLNKTLGSVTLNEAWGKINFEPGFFVQVGRMPLSYDDERLLGNADWNLAGNWHDALRLGFENTTHRVHLFATYNQNTNDTHGGYYSEIMPYKQMQGLWYHAQLLPEMPLGISVIALNIGYENGKKESDETYIGKTSFMQNFGTYLTFQPGDFDIAASFHFQMGKKPGEVPVSAFMASGRLGYTIANTVKLRAGYEYLSGNDGLNVNEHAFNPLFGTHHKFFGAMDYFTGRQPFGIQDALGGVTAYIGSKVTLDLDYHYMQMAERIQFIDLPKELGHEVDLTLSAKIFKDVTLQAGYSIILPSRTTVAIKETGNHESWQDWAWLSLSINPRILLTRW